MQKEILHTHEMRPPGKLSKIQENAQRLDEVTSFPAKQSKIDDATQPFDVVNLQTPYPAVKPILKRQGIKVFGNQPHSNTNELWQNQQESAIVVGSSLAASDQTEVSPVLPTQSDMSVKQAPTAAEIFSEHEGEPQSDQTGDLNGPLKDSTRQQPIIPPSSRNAHPQGSKSAISKNHEQVVHKRSSG
jgi:hypothetical protein